MEPIDEHAKAPATVGAPPAVAGAPSNEPWGRRIAAVLACHNRRGRTLACLRSFFESASRAGALAHAYLTDDGSTDGTAQAAAERFGPALTVISGDGSLFWTGGMQRAADAALACGEPLLLLLNDDVELRAEAIEVLLGDARATVAASQALPGVVAGVLADRTSGATTYGGVIRTSVWNPLRFRSIGACGTPFRCATMNGNVVLIPSACWSLAGGLDAGLPHRAADFDLGLRLARLGVSVHQSSEVVGWGSRNPARAGHEPGLPLPERFSRAFGTKGNPPRALIRYAWRHAGWLAPAVVARELLGTSLGLLRSHLTPRGSLGARSSPPDTRRIAYCLDFTPSPSGGKHRATLQKIGTLRRLGVDVKALFPGSSGRLGRVLDAPFAELRAASAVMAMPPATSAFVGRGVCGIAAQFLARLRGIPTVREVHGMAAEEVALLGRPFWWRLAHAPLFRVSAMLDQAADVRIYNNPRLRRALEGTGGRGIAIVVPNGSDPAERSHADMLEARERFGIPRDDLVLAFVGSASPWHGIEILRSLQRAFDEDRLPVSIVAGGGPVAGLEPNGRSISPLGSADCGRLMRACNACLLPAADVRTSPGSPLKLYDYLLNGRAVVTQHGLEGYDDEVIPHGVGLAVDFGSPRDAAHAIHRFLASLDLKAMEQRCEQLALGEFSWDARMQRWLRAIRAVRA